MMTPPRVAMTRTRFALVDRYACPCSGPVIILGHNATELDRALAFVRHDRSAEHRYYRVGLEGDSGYYRSPETSPPSPGPSPGSRLTSAGATTDRLGQVSSPVPGGEVSEDPPYGLPF